MIKEALEQIIIDCLKENLELSGELVPHITRETKPALDFEGFDSLRTIEVIVSLEDKLECDLPLKKVFKNKGFEEISVKDMVKVIDELIKATEK